MASAAASSSIASRGTLPLVQENDHIMEQKDDSALAASERELHQHSRNEFSYKRPRPDSPPCSADSDDANNAEDGTSSRPAKKVKYHAAQPSLEEKATPLSNSSDQPSDSIPSLPAVSSPPLSSTAVSSSSASSSFFAEPLKKTDPSFNEGSSSSPESSSFSSKDSEDLLHPRTSPHKSPSSSSSPSCSSSSSSSSSSSFSSSSSASSSVSASEPISREKRRRCWKKKPSALGSASCFSSAFVPDPLAAFEPSSVSLLSSSSATSSSSSSSHRIDHVSPIDVSGLVADPLPKSRCKNLPAPDLTHLFSVSRSMLEPDHQRLQQQKRDCFNASDTFSIPHSKGTIVSQSGEEEPSGAAVMDSDSFLNESSS